MYVVLGMCRNDCMEHIINMTLTRMLSCTIRSTFVSAATLSSDGRVVFAICAASAKSKPRYAISHYAYTHPFLYINFKVHIYQYPYPYPYQDLHVCGLRQHIHHILQHAAVLERHQCQWGCQHSVCYRLWWGHI